MKSRYFVGSIAIFGALGFLVASSLRAGTLQSVPVAKLRAADTKTASFVGQRLRMVGFVGPQKVVETPEQSAQGVVNVHRFAVVEGKNTVMVSYSDALPDTFRAGGPVQVDGLYSAPGVMQADHVLTKCPSKYDAGEKSNAVQQTEKQSEPKGELKQGALKSAQRPVQGVTS